MQCAKGNPIRRRFQGGWLSREIGDLRMSLEKFESRSNSTRVCHCSRMDRSNLSKFAFISWNVIIGIVALFGGENQ
jgi:hypothetical protein